MLARHLRSVFLALVFAVWSLALVGASCDRRPPADPAEAKPTAVAPTVTAPDSFPGVDLSVLSAEQKTRFAHLGDKLQSPCGKAQSLRASLAGDASCKRATFAARMVARRMADDLTDEEITGLYEARYEQKKAYEFDLTSSPSLGIPSAPVVLVEFFDYGCPHCKLYTPLFEEVQAAFPSEVVFFYKHFPLSSHPDSMPAAIAAVAAQKQGKFRDMHRKLMANQEQHAKDELFRYAKEIGLDMARFDADFQDPKVRDRVTRERDEGLKADLEGTPTLYLNGRMYRDPMTVEDISDWVKEELAGR